METLPSWLIQKYNVPAPRYTSYPTVPFWDKEAPTAEQWFTVVNRTFTESNTAKGISLYIHLPFCEALCTYCGCNTRITKNHGVELGYIQAVLQEWYMYLNEFPEKPIIRELHLGGGTPTFFSPENLKMLLDGITQDAIIHPEREFSFEGHPNNTTAAHLQVLYDCGFRRVSFGIQDFDLRVQKTINRLQPYENVLRVTEQAREIGYESVNFDLIYGLPYQTPETITATIAQVATLRPDRIAFYSYAHVPWVKPGQRSYTEKDLPDNDAKRALYELGKQQLTALGYTDIGMDHFALPHDPLYHAWQNNTLHRNFMGYTTCHTDLLIGLGASSISDARYAYLQNQKKVEDYKATLTNNSLAIFKGHLLSPEDLILKEAILAITCTGKLTWTRELISLLPDEAFAELNQMEAEGLIQNKADQLRVTSRGKAFIRNIAMVFDGKLRNSQPATSPVFSKAI
ncbi:oxygen-independent coproporphyrinogen III oxidase [Adhaeribacter swui]|uniref:Coproporphyrinogen-III oxidase n=1 Tax=Adhaeribacter swui TaxID=2086471 RepID=A0A7G7G914_9BACT|nr:oxygen-independent coproporphyrinogen III oxidase [Adhaeribacter swui]QNF33648.1 oxygen-independent coproporphyrinogen III oxidase [Adhaeribacter swui]